MNKYNLDGVKMNVVTTASAGVVNRATIFHFEQTGEVVAATYRGGGVVEGRLIGVMRGDRLDFRYCQLGEDITLDGGASECRLERLPDGRLKMTERFIWASRDGTGENIFEELTGGDA